MMKPIPHECRCQVCGNEMDLFGPIQFLNDIGYTPKTIADIGACCGVSTRAFRAAFPDATIIAFEPYDFARNQITGATKVFDFAIGHRRTAYLQIYPDPKLCHLIEDEVALRTRESIQPVLVLPLVDFELNYPFDFLHIDAEASSWEALTSAWLNDVKAVYVEVRLRLGENNQTREFIEHMHLYGFHLHGIYDVQTHGLCKLNLGFVRK